MRAEPCRHLAQASRWATRGASAPGEQRKCRLGEAGLNCVFATLRSARLAALAGKILAVAANAQVADDTLGRHEQPPAHTQPAKQPVTLPVKHGKLVDATNLERRIANVRTRDCRRGCDVVGACHTLFLMARTYRVTARRAHCTWLRRANNRGQPEGYVSTNFAFVRSEVAARRQISSKRDSLCCACGRLARLMPAGERTKRSGRGALATRFGCLTRASIIRQPERLESTTNIRQPATFDACARVAKGPPGMTSVNQRWRPGARRQPALAGWPGMSVRHSRTRPMTFVNGNREWVARSYSFEHANGVQREPSFYRAQRANFVFRAHPNYRKHSH